MSTPPVGDVTCYWIKPGQHPVQTHTQLAPHPIFRVLSTHNIPPSIFKLSSEALPISSLPNSDPDNPPSESFLGDYQSLQCLGWERFLADCDATCWFSTSSSGKQDRSHIFPVSRHWGRLRREALCVWDAATFSQQTAHLLNTSAARVQPRSAQGRPLLVLYGDSTRGAEIQRKQTAHFILPRISVVSHISFVFFCRWDVVPSVFLEGDTISGFKSS